MLAPHLPPPVTPIRTASHFTKSALSYVLQFKLTKMLATSIVTINNDSLWPMALAFGPWMIMSAEAGRLLFFQTLFESAYSLTQKAKTDAYRSPGFDVLDGTDAAAASLPLKVTPLAWDAILRSTSVLLVGERHHVSADHHSILSQLIALKQAGLTHLAIETPNATTKILMGLFLNSFQELFIWSKLLGITMVAIDSKFVAGTDADALTARNRAMRDGIAEILKANPNSKILYLLGSRHMIKEESQSVPELLAASGIAYKAVLPINPLSLYDRMRFSQWIRKAKANGIADKEIYYENPELTAATGVHGIANVPYEEAVPSWLRGLVRLPKMLFELLVTRQKF